MKIEWDSAHGGKCSMSPERAAATLKEWDDAWPGGPEEAAASLDVWRAKALAAEAKLRELGVPIPSNLEFRT